MAGKLVSSWWREQWQFGSGLGTWTLEAMHICPDLNLAFHYRWYCSIYIYNKTCQITNFNFNYKKYKNYTFFVFLSPVTCLLHVTLHLWRMKDNVKIKVNTIYYTNLFQQVTSIKLFMGYLSTYTPSIYDAAIEWWMRVTSQRISLVNVIQTKENDVLGTAEMQ